MEIYLTIAELAGMVKLSEQTIRRYVLDRSIPCHKIKKAVRFRLSEIEKWIDGGGIAFNGTRPDVREGDLFEGSEAGTAAGAESAGNAE